MEDKERYKAGERAIAPLFATVIPALIITVLMVVTAVSSRPKKRWNVDIPQPDKTDIDITEPDKPEPDPILVDDTDVVPDIRIDTPTPQGLDQLVPPQPQPFAAETSVVTKPAPENAVLKVKSVVSMPTLFGVRGGPNRA